MPIDVQCSCGAAFRVKDELAGKTGRCPKCGQKIQVAKVAPAKGAPAELGFADEPDREPSAGAPPCPVCGTTYGPDIVICTRCGVEIRTGRRLGGGADGGGEETAAPPPRRAGHRQPLRTVASQTTESKSVWVAALQALYNPLGAFDNLGYHLVSSQKELASVLVLFIVGFFAQPIYETLVERARQARGSTPGAKAAGEDDEPGGSEASDPGNSSEEDGEETEIPRPLPPLEMPAMAIVDREFAEEGYILRAGFRADEKGRLGAELTLEEKTRPEGGAFWKARVRVPEIDGETWTPLDGGKRFGLIFFTHERSGLPLARGKEISVEFALDLVIEEGPEPKIVSSKTYSLSGKIEPPKPGPFEEEEDAGSGAGQSTERSAVAKSTPRRMAEETAERAGFVALFGGFLLVVALLLALKAFVIDLVAGWATGARRFIQLGIVLLFLQGVTGVAAVPLAAAMAVLPEDVGLYLWFLYFLWKYALLGFAVAGVYDTPWYGYLIAGAFFFFELFVVPWALALIGLAVMTSTLL